MTTPNYNIIDKISEKYIENRVEEELQNIYAYCLVEHYSSDAYVYQNLVYAKTINDVYLQIFNNEFEHFCYEFFDYYQKNEILWQYGKYMNVYDYVDIKKFIEFMNNNDDNYIKKKIVNFLKKIENDELEFYLILRITEFKATSYGKNFFE